jgi:hypothetical protein
MSRYYASTHLFRSKNHVKYLKKNTVIENDYNVHTHFPQNKQNSKNIKLSYGKQKIKSCGFNNSCFNGKNKDYSLATTCLLYHVNRC